MTNPEPQAKAYPTLFYPVVVVGGGSGSSSFWLDLPSALKNEATIHALEVGKPLSPWRKLTRGYVPVVGRELLSELERRNLLPCHLLGATPLGSMAVLEASRLLANSHIHADELPGNAVSLTLLLAALSKEDPLSHAVGRVRSRVGSVCERIAILKELLTLAPYDVRRALGSIERPILCIASENEKASSWSSQPRLWELNPHSELHILDRGPSLAGVHRVILDFCHQAERAGSKE